MTTPSYVSLEAIRGAVLQGFPNTDTINLRDDTDFFHFGLDSTNLQKILPVLRTLGYGWANTGTIYKYPTIDDLTARLRRGSGDHPLFPEVATMFRLIDKYSKYPELADDPSEKATLDEYHILVTGATGSLGSQIVAQLVAKATVRTVYCLIRQRDDNDLTRVTKILKDRKLLHSAQDGKPTAVEQLMLDKIVPYHSNLTRADLGLKAEEYTLLKDTLTHVIHCAWTVNYNMQLTSFEHLILGTSNLLALCAKSSFGTPPSFHFTSSIAAAPALPGQSIQETLNTNPLTLIGASGYAQSKYVAKYLCSNAAICIRDMDTRVHRLGYLVGHRNHGGWSAREEYPLVMRSHLKIKTLPSLPLERVSWLPVDDAAKACVELMFAPEDELAIPTVFNVAHPQVISWDDRVLAGVEAAGHEFKRLPSREWAAALRAAEPEYPLLEYLESKYGNNNDVSSVIRTVVAEQFSAHLKGCQAITIKEVEMFVKQWDIPAVV